MLLLILPPPYLFSLCPIKMFITIQCMKRKMFITIQCMKRKMFITTTTFSNSHDTQIWKNGIEINNQDPTKSHSLKVTTYTTRSHTARFLATKNDHDLNVNRTHVINVQLSNFVAKMNFLIFKKKRRAKPKPPKQHVLETYDTGSSDYGYQDDLVVRCAYIQSINSSSREVIAEVEFHITDSNTPHVLQAQLILVIRFLASPYVCWQTLAHL